MTAAAATTSAIADAAAAAAANDAASAPTPEQPAKPLRLRGSRADAMRDIQNQAKIGQAIRNQRLRDQRELDEARREKQEWVQRTTELLESLFGAGPGLDEGNAGCLKRCGSGCWTTRWAT